jgi:hypothetical protein
MSNPRHTEPEPASRDGYAGMPRWVKWFIVVAIIAAVAVAVLVLVGGSHGPGRHLSSVPSTAADVSRVALR